MVSLNNLGEGKTDRSAQHTNSSGKRFAPKQNEPDGEARSLDAGFTLDHLIKIILRA
jgi:hypothetical protein